MYVCLISLQDVFLLDTEWEVFVWVGSGASPSEKNNGIPRAHVSYYFSSLEFFIHSDVKFKLYITFKYLLKPSTTFLVIRMYCN